MGKVIECVGRFATTPYCMEKVCYKIYSVEELCYYFCENTDLLEKDIVNTQLANWLETECGLKELSDNLYRLLTSGGSLAQFVVEVLDYVQFCSHTELRVIEQKLNESKEISAAGKKKKRADYYLKNSRFVLAMNEYESLLLEEEHSEDREFYGDIYHRMGIANANLFLFEKAANYFMKAYEEDGLEKHYDGYVATLRFMLSDMEFVKKVGEDALLSHAALQLEDRMQQATHEWEEDERKTEVDTIKGKHESSDATYYSQLESKITEWVEEYRIAASE